MKDKHVFFNPFRLISPRLDSEASRIEKFLEKPPTEVTCLEEGLLVMCGKLIEMTGLLHKTLVVTDQDKINRCETLGREIHEEEKTLTGDLVCSPSTSGELLKAVVLFPGRLERVGGLLESIINVSRIKAKEGIPFSDKAQDELDKLFGLFTDVLKNFRDVLVTRNRVLLEHLINQGKQVAQMTTDFALAHEDRLLEGLCSPKASSLYLDILDSIKGANEHIMRMCHGLLKIADTHSAAA
ncbi:MAG: Na/Pi cotransporter family protein [Deltaproteobacteria bacterium]|nr:Na/Pi cotransporter family protein [Deltaproteobacteria bacterium]